MTGLTQTGLIERIKKRHLVLNEKEAIDLFFILPSKVEITWDNGEMKTLFINGMNLEFKIE